MRYGGEFSPVLNVTTINEDISLQNLVCCFKNPSLSSSFYSYFGCVRDLVNICTNFVRQLFFLQLLQVQRESHGLNDRAIFKL